MDVCKKWLEYRGYAYVVTKEEGEIWRKDGEDLLLFSEISSSVQVKLLESLIKTCEEYNVKKAIKIYEDGTSSCVRNRKADAIELICTDELLCDITKHKFQPKMFKCNPSQAELAIGMHLHALPRFSIDDPMVRMMDWSKGDVIAICDDKCEILKDDATCCDATRFRIVF